VSGLHATGELSPSADPARTGKAIARFVEGLAIHVVMTSPGTSAEWQREFAYEHVRRLVTER
jgi:hypothetical protein